MRLINKDTEGPAEASPYKRHVPALDGIRGLAALGVVCSHAFSGTPHGAGEAAVQHALQFGATGVDLFFALSGFLITGILHDSLGDPHFFRKFYARRALRIFPLYYGILLAFLIFSLVQHSDYNGQLLAAALYLQNTTFIAHPIWIASGKLTLPLSHFWSLAIEEQFYLMWPLVVWLVKKRTGLMWLCAASICLCPLLRWYLFHAVMPFDSIHANVFARADSLLAGAALSLLLRGNGHDRILTLAPVLFGAGLVASVLAHISRVQDRTGHLPSVFVKTGLEHTFLIVFSTGLIALSFKSPGVRRIFSHGSLRFVGKYSYGIYVYHLLVFRYLSAPLRAFLAQHVLAGKGFGVLVAGLVLSAASVALSYLSYHLVEKQFLRLKKNFDYRPHAGGGPVEHVAK